MEEEKILTGFCRAADQSRMVTVEYTRGAQRRRLEHVDCSYESCPHRCACEIGRAIAALLSDIDCPGGPQQPE